MILWGMNSYYSQQEVISQIKPEIKSRGVAGVAGIVVSTMNNPAFKDAPGMGSSIGHAHLMIMDAVLTCFDDRADKVQALIQCIDGLTLLRKQPEFERRIKDNLALSFGYQIMRETAGCTNMAAMICEQGMVEPFLEAIDRFAPGGAGITYLADRCLRSAINYRIDNSPDNRLPGFVMVDKMLGIYPQWAQKADVSALLKFLSYTKFLSYIGKDQVFRSHEEALAAGRVVCKCLAYWLDNNKDKPYRLHLTSGPKENAISVLCGLACLIHRDAIGIEELGELTHGKRGVRLDKALARGLSLMSKENNTLNLLTYEELVSTRTFIKAKALEAVSSKHVKPAAAVRPAM